MSQVADADWSTTPAGTAPDGQLSNLIDSPSLGYQVTASNVVCAVFVTLTVGLRFYTRMHIVRGLGLDDYALLVAVVFWALLVAILEVMLKYGLGRHVWNISLSDFSPHYLLGRVLAAVFYTTSMFFVKLSLLLLYRRVFDVYRFYKRWWFVMAYTIAHTLTAIILSFFACRPPAAQWDLHIQHRQCITPKTLIAIPIFHCVNDLLILSLPIPLIWTLNLGPKRKMQVFIVFALGSASCIVSILRLYPIHKLVRQPRYGDVTWEWTPVAIWTQAELTFCIICACVPILKPFLSRHFPSLFPNNTNNNNNLDTAFESPGLSTTIRFPAMTQHHQQQQQQQHQQQQHQQGVAAGGGGGGGGGGVLGGGGNAVTRKASTWTIGRMSTRRRVWGLWGRWGASVADVEMGLHNGGGGGGMFARSEEGWESDYDRRGSGGGVGGGGGGGGRRFSARDGGGVGEEGIGEETGGGDDGGIGSRGSSGGEYGDDGGGGGGGGEMVGQKVVAIEETADGDGVGHKECVVEDVGVGGGGGGGDTAGGPASEPRSSTVIASEGVCSFIERALENDNYSELRFGVDAGRTTDSSPEPGA